MNCEDCKGNTSCEGLRPAGTLELCKECKWFVSFVGQLEAKYCQIGRERVEIYCKDYVPKRWENEPWENE